jgi:hypothetical protein
MATRESFIRAIRWGARIWGTGAALLWGAFFVEHLAWFSIGPATPPRWVWLQQGLHLGMIVALVAAWRHERAAGAVALVASVAFFAAVGGPRFWPFVATTVPPTLAFIYCGMRSRTS